MEFVNPNVATSRDKCAHIFGTMILRSLTFIHQTCIKARAQSCAQSIDIMRKKYRAIYDTLLTPEHIIEKVGPTLITWRVPIQKYDQSFFVNTDLSQLFAIAGTVSAPDDSDIAIRNDLIRILRNDEYSRTIIFDALNLLMTLYAKYCILEH